MEAEQLDTEVKLASPKMRFIERLEISNFLSFLGVKKVQFSPETVITSHNDECKWDLMKAVEFVLGKTLEEIGFKDPADIRHPYSKNSSRPCFVKMVIRFNAGIHTFAKEMDNSAIQYKIDESIVDEAQYIDVLKTGKAYLVDNNFILYQKYVEAVAYGGEPQLEMVLTELLGLEFDQQRIHTLRAIINYFSQVVALAPLVEYVHDEEVCPISMPTALSGLLSTSQGWHNLCSSDLQRTGYEKQCEFEPFLKHCENNLRNMLSRFFNLNQLELKLDWNLDLLQLKFNLSGPAFAACRGKGLSAPLRYHCFIALLLEAFRFADKKVIIFEDIGDWGPKVPQDMAALLDVRTRKFTPIPTRTEFVTGLFRILSPLRRYDIEAYNSTWEQVIYFTADRSIKFDNIYPRTWVHLANTPANTAKQQGKPKPPKRGTL